MYIEMIVVADMPRRERIGRVVRDAVREQFGATPWTMRVRFRKCAAFRDDGEAVYVNEGNRR